MPRCWSGRDRDRMWHAPLRQLVGAPGNGNAAGARDDDRERLRHADHAHTWLPLGVETRITRRAAPRVMLAASADDYWRGVVWQSCRDRGDSTTADTGPCPAG